MKRREPSPGQKTPRRQLSPRPFIRRSLFPGLNARRPGSRRLSRSPDLRLTGPRTPSRVPPMAGQQPSARPPRSQWRYRSGFAPDSLFSAPRKVRHSTALCILTDYIPLSQSCQWGGAQNSPRSQSARGRYPRGRKMAGSMFATFTGSFRRPSMFTAMPMRMTPPTADISATTRALR